jgi:anti-sigma regulatory factor (Ser/Thr protein kinase)
MSLGVSRPGAPHEGRALPVLEASQVGEARRIVAAMGDRLGLDETRMGRLAILATEAAGNLVKHGGGGELVVRTIGPIDRPGLEMIALDRGPGIADVARSLRDGYSTSGTPGTGLGAIRRLSDEFDLYSTPGRGTAVLSRLYGGGGAPMQPRLQEGVVCLPLPREEVSGDAWAIEPRPAGARVAVVDGLGHGPDAHQAALRALAALSGERGTAAQAVETCHHALRSTRGAAVAVAEVDVAGRAVRFAGVGNVTGAVIADGRRHNMVSVNGTAGQGTVRLREFAYVWEPGAVLVMASDGLGTRWSLADYPGLVARHPALVAGVLYRDHGRGRDDVTVVVVRERPPAGGGGP